ncbi:MAG: hypothetical protein Q8S73_15975 [Deltaproteobacteria bacterium]|nr:hypothetical protein [Myxococcales bacterium]MDP3215605.1 hypothetical protein [Deltaproteobacteria bacterium]
MSVHLDPEEVTRLLAKQLPESLHPHLLLVGSLAAAYHFRESLDRRGVNTKDADVIVQPASALRECQDVANTLLNNGWLPYFDEKHPPGADDTPDTELPIVRLLPPDPGAAGYFVELLALPELTQETPKALHRCQLQDGTWWAIPSFRFMAVLQHEQRRCGDSQLRYAAPAMMALANLLAHPTLGTEIMSKPIGGVFMKRSAKDLGRVLGLALLTEGEIDAWPEQWDGALRTSLPRDLVRLAASAGDGLRELVSSRSDLDNARHALAFGILANKNITVEQLRAMADELFTDTLPGLVRLSLR